MGRSNNAARQRNSKGRLNRRQKGEPRTDLRVRSVPRVEAEDLVVPDGLCYRNSRKPKAKFNTESKAGKALRQAQQMRLRNGSSHVEKRYYLCETAENGCGAYHLTSRDEYDPSWKRGQA